MRSTEIDGDDTMVAPDGSDIVGTHDHILDCTAEFGSSPLTETDLKNSDLPYSGNTEVNYDGQETVVWRGHNVFVDDSGDHWHSGQLVRRDAPDTADIPKPLHLLSYNELLKLVHDIYDEASSTCSPQMQATARRITETGLSV